MDCSSLTRSQWRRQAAGRRACDSRGAAHAARMRGPLFAFAVALALAGADASAVETLRLPLSGRGPSDAVEWDFQVTGGRRAGEKARIPVPSHWEQHGFGDYDYGMVPAEDKHKEDGIYQRNFTVPGDWRGMRVRIVFEGSMTDTSVSVNGRPAGPVHQGGFYRFHHDITELVRFGAENRLEVLVSKDSANLTIEGAERGADYWVFGGIYRPVWLEARPPQSIEWTAINAGADGSLGAFVHLAGEGGADRVVARVLTKDGRQAVGSPIEAKLSGVGPIELKGHVPAVRPWSAEEPNLYQVEVSLMEGRKALHRITERTGFRTMETRPGQGVFLNGRRITVKGVNRHCFRPESGRALDPAHSLEDVRLIKAMNMNSVRCSHYPPDKEFLDACDELGLYVESELCTWQKPVLDTPSARRLIGQMIRRDVNHPSILWWANGNEGGWNTEVDGDFGVWDIQKRPVLHPWAEFSGYQTRHYPIWSQLQADLADRFLVMPTEFLHGLFDGGHGAGLEDYWNAITSRPNGVGGFLWVMADEGVMRTDRGGAIDNWGINAPDGIVGPHHEKEASFLTAKDVFCPVQIAMTKLPADFDGRLQVSNRYDFRDLSGVRFSWKLAASGGGDAVTGVLQGPPVPARESGSLLLPLPGNWRNYRSLELRADDSGGNELWTWCWPVSEARRSSREDEGKRIAAVRVTEGADAISVAAGGVSFAFNATNGRLEKVEMAGGAIPLGNGPRLVEGRVAQDPPAGVDEKPAVSHRMLESGACRIEAKSAGAFTSFAWTVNPDGSLDLDYVYQIDGPSVHHGVTFDLPEDGISSFSWTGQGPERVWANRMRGSRFGSFGNEFRKLAPGVDYRYPHAAGFFAGVREAEIAWKAGRIRLTTGRDDTFVRIGTNDEGEKITTFWPDGNFSVMHAIPAIGNKFHKPAEIGPQSMPHPAAGRVVGGITLRFDAGQ